MLFNCLMVDAGVVLILQNSKQSLSEGLLHRYTYVKKTVVFLRWSQSVWLRPVIFTQCLIVMENRKVRPTIISHMGLRLRIFFSTCIKVWYINSDDVLKLLSDSNPDFVSFTCLPGVVRLNSSIWTRRWYFINSGSSWLSLLTSPSLSSGWGGHPDDVTIN